MTNFAYNDDIPATNNNPSNDQPLMLINTQSIAGIIAQDHVGFQSADGGFHKWVNFNANNVPAGLPTGVQSVVFTKNNSLGFPFPFFANASLGAIANALPMLPDITDTANTHFGCKIGSLIINWGTGAAGAPTIITFQVPFTSNTYGSQATFNGPFSGSAITIIRGAPNMQVFAANAFTYICIGT